MTKKITLILSILAAFSFTASADTGGWKIHAVFGDDLTKIIDTGSIVYYVANGNLFSYDKDEDESEHYSKQTKLNDAYIDDIFYNFDDGYLFIAYDNGNIDILYDNGKVVNIPDIYSSSVSSKTIHWASFKDGYIYVGAGFGYAILNSSRSFEVTESHIWDTGIRSIALIGDYLWISTDDNLYYSPAEDSHYSLSSFTQLNMGAWGNIHPIDENSFLFDTWGLQLVTMSDTGTPKVTWYRDVARLTMLQPTTDGFIAIDKLSPCNLLTISADGTSYYRTELPDEMQGSLLSSRESDGSLWELSTEGIRHLTLDDDGSTTIYSDYFKYNSSSVDYPAQLCYNEANGELLVTSIGPYEYLATYDNPAYINILKDGKWSDVTPESVTTIGYYAENILKDPYTPVFDPDDPDTYYIGTWFEGAYKITDGVEAAKYDWTNSPLEQDWVCTARALAFDAAGNLWILQSVTDPKLIVLPKAKLSQTTLTEDDWIYVDVDLPEASDYRCTLFITQSSDIKIVIGGSSGKNIIVIDDGGDPSSSSIKYTTYVSGNLYDQDGNEYNWDTSNCLAEGTDGKVWIGTNNGVIAFDPTNAQSTSFSITRIKVPRNDGTNTADYLLNSLEVTAIAVDGINRKWLGTVGDGLYLVSSDGSEILQHFTADNSDLPSDQILSICCDPNNNTVYIGTPNGLVEYYSDAAPAAESYSDIYAYPNPVTPDFSGLVTITGLMENSLVKIADAAGNVIRSLQSSGGMATWDACYSNGKRVKTGVYFVLASQNENDSSSGVVTKILVIQ